MASEDVDFRLNLQNRAQTASGLRSIANELDNAGDQANQAGRQAAIAGRQFDSAGRLGHAAGKAIRLGFVGVAAAGYGAFKFSQSAIGKASDLNETVNKSNVIFGKQAKSIRVWARTADESFGLSKEAALGSAAGFGDMFTQIGFVGKQSAKMSKDVVGMAADFGSFNNLGTEDVLDRISAGFRGEYDSLQKLVPNINAARVQQEALNETGKKNADALTAQDKALAVLNILHKDGARAAGDFDRTSDGLANKQKILGAEYDNVSAKIGKTLLPLQLDLVNFISDRGIPALNDFADWFRDDGAPAIGDFIDKMRPLANQVLPAAKDALGAVRDIAEDAAPYVADLVGAFRDMPDWAKKALVGGVVLGGAGLKLKNSLAGQAVSGLAGSVLSRAKPVPVFVTNPGFGTGIGGGVGGGSKGLPGALKFAGAAAAGFTVVDSAPDVFSTVADSLFGGGSGSLKKAADEFGYDVSRLMFDIQTYGDQGSYYKQVQADLDSRAHPGIVQDYVSLFNPYVTDNERASAALKGLKSAVEGTTDAFDGISAPDGPLYGPKVPLGPSAPRPTGADPFTSLLTGNGRGSTSTHKITIKPDPPNFFVPGLTTTTRATEDLNSLFGAMGRERIRPNLAIDGIDQANRDLDVAQGKVDRLAQPRTSTLTVNVAYAMGDYVPGPRQMGAPNVDGARAAGGPVARGRRYLVGEHGPEIMEARTDGYVHPNRDFPHLRSRAVGDLSIGQTYARTNEGAAPIVIQLEVDGKRLAEVVHAVDRTAGARA